MSDDIWPPPPTTQAPTPIFRPLAVWERVCGACSILFAMIATVSLGIAASEAYLSKMAGGFWRRSQQDEDVMILGYIAGILLLTVSLSIGILGRRSWQGRTGMVVAIVALALGVAAFVLLKGGGSS